jgi:alpha,alpha-trehalase
MQYAGGRMKKIICSTLLPLILSCSFAQQPLPPDKIFGSLFVDVQMQRVFPDQKTFVDCVPKRKPADILSDYEHQKGPHFNLKKFVEDNFDLPPSPESGYKSDPNEDVVTHIQKLWAVLKRVPDKPQEGSSLLALPYPYMVPGGRFREIYYWDSYFTMLGLKESGESTIMEDMIKNFAYLIDSYGHIPNGNRTYYLSRSQPPFFSLMIGLLAQVRGDSVYLQYQPELEKEYQFWMDGADKLKSGQAYRRAVRLADGTLMNRYWDDYPEPRQESYREDVLTASASGRNHGEMYQHLRAGAESGMDFSSRWFADQKHLSSIQTTDIVAVDLNSLLYQLETAIAKARTIHNDDSGAAEFRQKARHRAEAIDKFCWNQELNFYVDYNFKSQRMDREITPAGLYPFCFLNEHPDYLSFLGEKVAAVIRSKLLQPGGLAVSTYATGQQWDAPNGWAPLEWMMIWGLDRCGQKELASDVARRWINLNNKVYKETGKLMEKYNVVDISKEAGGGEYPGQDGFGWTNGVLLALIKKYGPPGP